MTGELLPLCECGCGLRVTKPGNRFIYGHQRRGKHHTPETCAAISAAAKGVPKPPRTPEHCAAMSKAHTGVPLSPSHRAAISAAQTGVPHPPERCAAISKGLKNSKTIKAKGEAQKGVPRPPEVCAAISKGLQESDANKAQIESMRGGNDLVDHHYIYDHSDLSLNTVQITRSDHARLHALLKKLGYIVPHINVKENQQ